MIVFKHFSKWHNFLVSGIYLLTVSCLTKGVKAFEARWIGWAGVNVPDEVGQKALTKALAEKVFTSFN